LRSDHPKQSVLVAPCRCRDESLISWSGNKALRVLADHDYLHARFYGSEKQTDFHIF